jgi:hypothetical protein
MSKLSKIFKDDTQSVNGHQKGYITDGQHYPKESVQACQNMDFFPTYDSKRLPYLESDDLSSVLPASYTIAGMYEKTFISADGTEQECLIVVAQRSGDAYDTKIYVSHYFNPASTYANYHDGSAGWVAGWTELTETLEIPNTQTWTDGSNGQTSKITTVNGTFPTAGQVDEYYKGWFLYTHDGKSPARPTGDCLGFITKFDYNTDGSNSDLYIAHNSSATAVDTLTISTIATSTAYMLVRFPVITHNIANWRSIDNVSFADSPNALRISCGYDSKILWLGFLPEKNFFGDVWNANNTEYEFDQVDNTAPPQVTQISHPYSDGELIKFADINTASEWCYDATNFTEHLNDTVFMVDNAAADTFDLFDEDGNDTIDATNLSALYDGSGNGSTIIYAEETTDYEYQHNWDGFWFCFDCPNVLNKGKVLEAMDNPDSASGGRLGHGTYNFEIAITEDDEAWGTGTGCDNTTPYPDVYRFYEDTDLSELGVILEFNVGWEMVYQDGASEEGNQDYFTWKIWNNTIQLDGFQELALKRFIAKPFTITTSDTEYYNLAFKFALHYKVDFDRRISAGRLYHSFLDNAIEFDKKEEDCFLLSEKYGGDVSVNTEGDDIGGCDHNLYVVGLNMRNQNYDQGYDNASPLGSRSAFETNPENIGLEVNAYLNNYYWKDVHVSCKDIIRMEDIMLAANLSNDSVSSDEDLDKSGWSKMAISQIQQGDVYTPSIYSDERTKQVTSGEELIKCVPTIGNRFLAFSKNYLTLYNLINPLGGVLANEREWMHRGAYDKKSIVLAKTKDQFAGIYWISSNNTVYAYLNDFPEDIIYGKWKDEYETIFIEAGTDQRESAVGGYLPRTKDVFFTIYDEVDEAYKIYIWNIPGQHWKIYFYEEEPEYITTALDGELRFANTQALYKTEGRDTTFWNDKQTVITPAGSVDGTKVDFFLGKYLNHGSRTTQKVPDRIDMKYESTTIGESAVYLDLSVGKGGSISEATILHPTVAVSGTQVGGYDLIIEPIEKVYKLRTRKRTNFYNFYVASRTGTSIYLKTFKLHELHNNAKLTGRRMTHI